MSGTVLIGNPPIEVRLKRNARAKRLTLRLSRTDGKATLTLPTRAPLREAKAFAQRQEEWLRNQLSKLPETTPLIDGAFVPFQGENLRVSISGTKSVYIEGNAIYVGAQNSGVRLQAFMKTHARNLLVPAVDKYASNVGRPFNRVTLRDTRSRWGSCSAEGNLMFSWRLVMAPPEVLDYVAAHEVAHLVEMNHSPAFWELVGNLMPDYQNHRNWLREHGAKLHAISFTS